jgi:hypothetical protein
MAKCMFGEITAGVVDRVIRANTVRTPHDIAMLSNAVLEQHGMRANLDSTHINSFISYHQLGQTINRERLIAAQRGRKLPAWADARTPLADSIEKKRGQLVPLKNESGLAEIDYHFGNGVATMHRLARSLPSSRQRDVSVVVDVLDVAAMTIKMQQQIIDAKTSENAMARLMISQAA